MSSVLALWSSRCTEAYALFPRLSPGIPHSVYSFHAHLLNTWSPQTSPCTIYVYPANPLGFGKRFPSFVVTWFESLKRLSLSEQAFNLHFMEPLPSQPQRILACSSLPTRCFEDARILPKSFPLLRNKVHPLSPASKTLQGLPVFADFFFSHSLQIILVSFTQKLFSIYICIICSWTELYASLYCFKRILCVFLACPTY